MDTQLLSNKIKEFFSGEIISDEQTLNLYSHDTSLFEIKPQLVVFPKDKRDVEELVKFVAINKKEYPNLSLTARSAGTDMSGGAINDSIIMDFTKYFNKIGEINEAGTKVEPGVYYRDFEKKTLSEGLFMPSYPASRSICAIGGIVNNNSGGEKTLAHGKAINYVNSLKMVLSDGKQYLFEKIDQKTLEKKLKQKDFEGKIYNQVFNLIDKNYDLIKQSKPDVSKNSTGYNIWDVYDKEYFDLSKIFVGAQGTLGFMTEVELKLIPHLNHHGLLVIYLNDIKILPHLINDILKSKPESFEVFDDHTLRLAIRFMPQFIQILGLMGVIGMGFQFAPDLIRFAFSGLPKFTMLVEFDSNDPKEIAEKVEKLKEQLASYPVRMELAETDVQADRFWTIRRESFNLLRKNVKNKHTAPFIDDFIVKPEYLIEFFPKLIDILEKHQIDFTIAGHMGDGNFHIIPLMDFNDPKDKEKIPIVEDEVNKLVFKFKGSMSAEHNEGLIRGYYLKEMYGEKMFEVFKQIKEIFDPLHIFNPHKKTDATKEYSLSHIRSHF